MKNVLGGKLIDAAGKCVVVCAVNGGTSLQSFQIANCETSDGTCGNAGGVSTGCVCSGE
jgi:hypothetical protein